MEVFTRLIKEDMKPALGVTEPGAIAYGCSRARSYTKGEVLEVNVKLNSGQLSDHLTGD